MYVCMHICMIYDIRMGDLWNVFVKLEDIKIGIYIYIYICIYESMYVYLHMCTYMYDIRKGDFGNKGI
jgi:hypothetical protein